jgi:hypothetical protein
VGAVGFIGQKGIDFGRGGRQADQIEGHPPYEFFPVHLWCRREIGGLEAGQNKTVERIFHPARVTHFRK